ncbi:MAG: hypothetical protein L7H00_04950, partial [Vulcanisaeta sp.]|nr:hypothetical protein [Vulcanisaeta sp.]
LHNELLNLTNQLLQTYLKMETYQARAMSSLVQISNYEEELQGLILEDEAKVAVLNAITNEYLSYLHVNSTNVSIDVTVEETFIIEMPSVVNTKYLLQLLNETTAQGNETVTHRVNTAPTLRINPTYAAVLGMLVVALITAIIIRKLR